MTTVIAQSGDMVDQLAWREGRGEASALEVYDTHRGLAALGPVLLSLVRVDLPDVVEATPIRPRRLAGGL